LTKKKERIADPRSLARNHTVRAIQTIAGIMDNGQSEDLKLRASDILLQRGWGRPPQPVTGADGEGDIRITIRTILEGKK
jgi:hypothetical protein